MLFTPFIVICSLCNHKNRPHPSPLKGVRKVLSGEFTNCIGCGVRFTKITVPNRPLVKKLTNIIENKTVLVEIVEHSGGDSLFAYGFA